MKKTILIAAALVAMTACNKSLIEVTPAEEFGTITLGVTTDTEMVVTKAEGETQAVDLSGYNVTLKRGSDVIWTKEYVAIEEADLKQPAGTYTLYVENLTEAEAAPSDNKGQVRVAGSADVTVKAGVSTPATVKCEAINSRVTVANTFAEGVFTTAVATITDGARAFDMTWGHNEANGVYYAAGKSIAWTLNVTLSNGTKKTYAKESATTTVAKKWTQINFTNLNTDGTITVQIVVDGTIAETVVVSETIDPLGGTVTE